MIKFNLLSKLYIIFFILSFHFALTSCKKSNDVKEEQVQDKTSLPMQNLSLVSLDEFRSPGENWFITGDVYSDYQKEGSMQLRDGTGVLVNIPSDEARNNIFTVLEHGDIELKGEFLVPKGSNSGIYFQGRYEFQILDSWKESNPTFFDMGGIFERGARGMADTIPEYRGRAPDVNASLAPGLWQKFHILFRAPRFDGEGNKVEHARFEWVELNGVRIHENVEVTGPTRAAAFEGETMLAPLMIQGDHGPVAFRNIKFKTYDPSRHLRLEEMTYTVYDYTGYHTPVNFDTLEILDRGATNSFNVSELSLSNQNYAIRFIAKVVVPISGDYLFQTELNQGGNLYINEELVIENKGEIPGRRFGNIVHLEVGVHHLELSYFRIRGALASVFYEGPEIEWRQLGSTTPPDFQPSEEPLRVEPNAGRTEIIAGFANYDGQKRTHTLSVGHAEGINYTYDLGNASLLKFWRTPFADVQQMWQGRGNEQLIVPLNAAVEAREAVPIVIQKNEDLNGNELAKLEFGVNKIMYNEDEYPVFEFKVGDVNVRDLIQPSDEGDFLTRHLKFESQNLQNNIAARIAQSDEIELLSNELYRINGKYYLKIESNNGEDPIISELNGVKTLLIPILHSSTHSEIRYNLIW
ncbi:MAG: DUF1080 domain-containing protein [Balneolaceae bacterium]|nr:DUF1080 domain-containing protein [Balneolaceae bacterium]